MKVCYGQFTFVQELKQEYCFLNFINSPYVLEHMFFIMVIYQNLKPLVTIYINNLSTGIQVKHDFNKFPHSKAFLPHLHYPNPPSPSDNSFFSDIYYMYIVHVFKASQKNCRQMLMFLIVIKSIFLYYMYMFSASFNKTCVVIVNNIFI